MNEMNINSVFDISSAKLQKNVKSNIRMLYFVLNTWLMLQFYNVPGKYYMTL